MEKTVIFVLAVFAAAVVAFGRLRVLPDSAARDEFGKQPGGFDFLRALGVILFAAIIGGSALHCVASFGHPDILLALTGAGAGLHLAAENGDIAKVKRLIVGGADVNAKDKDGFTPLHRAAYWGKTETVLALVNAGAYVNAKTNYGFTPLHSAAVAGQTEIALVLVKAGADLHVRNDAKKLPLDVAATKHGKNSEIVRMLRQAMEGHSGK